MVSDPPLAETAIADLLSDLFRMDAFIRSKSMLLRDQMSDDPDLRGLVITDAEFEELVERPLGTSVLDGNSPPPPASLTTGSPWQHLLNALNLGTWERDLLLVCLLPEIDLAYERLYAFLQDDVTRKRPSVDLALKLLCANPAERLAARAYLAPEAPLRAWRLVRLVPHQDGHDSLLSQNICLDPGIVAYLIGAAQVEGFLPECLTLERTPEDAGDLPLDGAERETLRRLAAAPPPSGLWLHFSSQDPWIATEAARALSLAWDLRLLRLDWLPPQARDGPPAVERREIARLARREVLLHRAILYIQVTHPADGSLFDDVDALTPLPTVLDGHPLPVIWAAPPQMAPRLMRASPLPWEQLSFSRPAYAQRAALWARALSGGGHVPDEVLADVAGRYRLGGEQIVSAARLALAQQAARADSADTVTFAALAQAARAVSSHRLGELARQIEPHHTWADLVLPQDRVALLHELCDQYKHRHRVYEEWGFGARLSLGRGLSVLFAGPSGTGKTMAAEVMANELALDLFKIDLSGVVSKYIGETEKNLERIFALAHDANAILLFDEADALFGKRSETKDAHDRYANIEVSYLLQKIEEYDGIVILTSNLRQNLDEAFLRRLQFTVEFPLPDEEARQRIWRAMLPAQAPLNGDLDVADLAQRFRLSGGSIRTIALNAAFLAARDGAPIGMGHMLWAVRREFQKLGKLVDDQQFQAVRAVVGEGLPPGGRLKES